MAKIGLVFIVGFSLAFSYLSWEYYEDKADSLAVELETKKTTIAHLEIDLAKQRESFYRQEVRCLVRPSESAKSDHGRKIITE
jgi:hypothetical protein